MDFQISLAHDYSANQKLADKQMEKFVADFKATADDEVMRKAFAATLAIPVLQNIPPQTSVRNIFAVDQIPAGALAEYPIDLNDINDAVVMPRLGAVPQNLVVGDSLIVPTFEISNSVEWKLSFVRDGRFNIVERALEKMAQAFIRLEEASGWATISAAKTSNNTVSKGSETTLSKALFNTLITSMRAKGYNPTDIYVSPNRASDIRNWTTVTNGTGHDGFIDPFTQKEIFEKGGLGSIYGVTIHELRTLADTDIYMFDTSRFGVMPIRTPLQTFDKPDSINRLRAGVLAWEELGFGVIDKMAMRYCSLA